MDPIQQALQQGTPEELAQLELALAARRQGGVIVVGGLPFIHGVPAIPCDEPPLLACFASWRCPHCRSHLSADGFICLNGCHLTQPAFQRMQAGLAESQAVVDRGNKLLDGLIARDRITPVGRSPYAVDTFPPGFDQYRSLMRVDINRDLMGETYESVARWMREQPLKGFCGIGSTVRSTGGDIRGGFTRISYGLFNHPDDALMFKLVFGGQQG